MTSTADSTRLGATVVPGDRTRFVVWAPNATTVDVVIGVRHHSLQRDGAYWVGEVDGVAHGDRYRYVVDGAPLADPASRWQPDGVQGPAAVVDDTVIRWHDDDWTGHELTDTVL